MSIKVRVFPSCFELYRGHSKNADKCLPLLAGALSCTTSSGVLDNEQAKPYHYRDSAVILGDSAHAMVPFYGQGLNCGLEDVRVLDILLRDAGVDPTIQTPDGQEDPRLARALATYSATRHEDLVAACELAMDN